MATPELEFNTIPQVTPVLLAPNKSLLRFSTAGSVDDGKSTLIGRLLYDSQSVYEDQIASVRKSRVNRSSSPIDLSLLTDGLRAEREQGITIDVAYRYFSTPKRKFIIADTPGHEQYTRNMATGASTADLAIVLIDATKGVLPQSRRHAYIASLLGIRHVVAAVNKMDLVDYARDVFERISQDFQELASQLDIGNAYIIPMSALAGDNVVVRSDRMAWFHGPTLLEHLEAVDVQERKVNAPVRFPVQRVVRPDATFRGFAGQLASGILRPGTEVIALPSGIKTRVKAIASFDGDLDHATAGSSITVLLENEIDISRGDLLADNLHPPGISRSLQANLVWMHSEATDQQKFYLLKHTTRIVRARIKSLQYRVDVNTYRQFAASALHMNDIGTVELECVQPLFFDTYAENQTTGSFILIDPVTNATVAAGMIRGDSSNGAQHFDIGTRDGRVSSEERIRRFGHPPAAVWISGSLEMAELVERTLFQEGWHTHLIDMSEYLPQELNSLAKELARLGAIVVFSTPTEQKDLKLSIRERYSADSFFEYSTTSGPVEEKTREIVMYLERWRESHFTVTRQNQ